MTQIINAIEMTEVQEMLHKVDIRKIEESIGVKPRFVIINASDDAGNSRYIQGKVDAGTNRGLDVQVMKMGSDCTEEDIQDIIDVCNRSMVPVILQMPTYDHIDAGKLISTIDYKVDADGFTKEWLGMVALGNDTLISPATPKGVINLLDFHDVDIKGKVAVVIGKSNHVGKPLCTMLMNRGATVVNTNSSTLDLKFWLKQADIIIPCVGKTGLIQPEDVKEGCVIIGVGFSYEGRKQVLDFDLDVMVESGKPLMVSNRINCTGKATINALIDNVIELYKMNFEME